MDVLVTAFPNLTMAYAILAIPCLRGHQTWNDNVKLLPWIISLLLWVAIIASCKAVFG